MRARKPLSIICSFILAFGLGFPATALAAVGDVEGQEEVSGAEQAAPDQEALDQAVQEPIEQQIDLGDPDAEHAYDPFAEIEAQQAEQEYREACDIVEGTVLFTLRDWRAEGAGEGEGSYIGDGSAIARENGLTGVEVVYETKASAAEEREGLEAWDVYYQANTRTDDVWALVDKLAARDDVLSAEPDYLWGTQEVAQATAVEMNTTSSWSESLCIGDVWNSVTDNFTSHAPGYGTVVAVIDTGVDYTHPDLDANIWTNSGEIPGNGIDDDGNGYVDDVRGIDLIEMDGDPMDDHGHGTHVAGIIAMEANGIGGVGVAYGAKVMCIKAGQANGSLASTDIAKAVKYAAANGADVINMSFGGPGRSTLVEAALSDAFPTCVLVAAAGNNGKPTTDAEPYYPNVIDIYPGGYSYVIGVMATYSGGGLAGFSNWDYLEGYNCEYEIAAPGVEIYSTLPNRKYASWSGTSMATPIVAASAAVVRGKYTDKSVYTSRFVAGQLVGATSKVVAYMGQKNDLHYFPWLSLADSLNRKPTPKLYYEHLYVLDDPEVSPANNGDGIVQAGETIDIGFVMRNRWGIAKDAKVTASATSDGGAINKHVTFLSNEASFAEIGTYMTADNGLVYDNGELVSISNPIRLKIDENTQNDAIIQLHLLWSAKNGMDPSDQSWYGPEYESTFSFMVQRGQTLRGIISEDMTLTADKLWIVDRAVTVAEGVTVNVDPGTQIQFWSADPLNANYDTQIAAIGVKGTMNFNGTEDNPIKLYPSKIFEEYGVNIGTGYGANDTRTPFTPNNGIHMNYVDVINPQMHIDTGNHIHAVQNSKRITRKYYEGASVVYDFGDAVVAANTLSNSLFEYYGQVNGADNYSSSMQAWASSSVYASTIDTCAVMNSVTRIASGDQRSSWAGLFGGVLSNSLIYNANNYNGLKLGHLVESAALNLIDTPTLSFTGNAIINPTDPKLWYRITSEENVDVSGNYWGTDNEDIIERYIVDAYDNPRLAYTLNYAPYLTLESPELASIYPFVADVYVTDAAGNRLEVIVGGQNVQIHVRFNRDMASDIQPMVSFGGSEPYTDYVVAGDWATAREWVGTMAISPFINQGMQYFRVKNAAAASDKWLLTGTDEARFSFEITKVGALAMTLQGTGAAGRNELSWVQDDYETLAGYNLYRTTSYDPGTAISEQAFRKINSSIITPDIDASGNVVDTITTYTDTAVEQGVDYYYYFTVVDTAFNESEPSNVVKCTPLDTEVPVIQHSVIASVAQGNGLTIRADVTDNVSVEGVTLHYRMEGADAWVNAPMRNTTGDSYQAVIGPNETEIGTLQYWIEATDGENVTTCGTADLPNQVAIADPITVTSVSIAPASANMQIGEDLQLVANVTPEGVTQPGLAWSTSDIAVATVADDGTVTAQGPGKATITCASANGKSGTATIVVRKRAETTLSVGVVNAAPGETVEVPVSIDKNCGIAGMKLAFTYDSEKLTYEGVEPGKILGDATLINGAALAGVAGVVWYTPQNITADGELIKLLFTVKEGVDLGTNLPIGVAYGADGISDADFNYLDVNTSAGAINVAEWLIGDVYEDGVINVRDPILLQQYLTSLADLSLHQLKLADLDGNGSVGMGDLVGLGKLVADAPLTSMAPQMLTLGAQEAAAVDLAVAVGNCQVGDDGTAKIPVDFAVDGTGAAALRFTVSYDALMFALSDVQASDALQGGSLMFNDLGGGKALVTWYNASKAAVAGKAMTLVFNRVGSVFLENSAVTLSAADGDVVALNGHPCAIAFTDGFIAPSASDLNEVRPELVADAVAAINAIGLVETDENGDPSAETAAAIAAARAAYNALTNAEKAQVANYAALQTAEKKVADDKAAAEAIAQAAADLQAAKDQALADLTAAQQKAAADLKAAQDQAAADLAAAQQQAASDLATANQKAAANLKAAQDKAEADLAAAQKKAAEDLAAAVAAQQAADGETLAAAQKQAADDLAAAQQQAAADLKAAQDKAAADLSAAQDKAAEDIAAANEKAAADIKAVQDKAEADLVAAQQQAAADLAAAVAAQQVADSDALAAAQQKAAEDLAAANEKAAADLKAAKDEADVALAAAQKQAESDLSAAQQKASEELAAVQAKADADLKAAQDKAAADLKAANAKAADELKAAQDKAAADLKAAREQAEKDIAVARREAAEQATKASQERIAQLESEIAVSKAKELVKLAKVKLDNKKTKSSKAGKVTVVWTKVAKATGYQVKIGSKTYTIKKASTLKKTVSAKKGAKVKVKVRAYRKLGTNTLFGPWSKTKTVTVKK